MNIKTKVSVQFLRDRIVAALRTSAAAGLNEGGVSLTRTFRQGLNRSEGWQSKPGGYPGNSRGTLARSVDLYQRAKPDFLTARVGSNVPEAWYMQFGVKAKGKGLTIPLNVKARNALAACGSIRVLARMERLVFLRSHHKADTVGVWVKVVGKIRGGKQRMEPWVALRKSVKARPWVTLGVKEGKDKAIAEVRRAYLERWAAESRKIFSQLGRAKK